MKSQRNNSGSTEESKDETEQAGGIELVKQSLRGLMFGQVVVHVHDGAIVQIERTEKVRPTSR